MTTPDKTLLHMSEYKVSENKALKEEASFNIKNSEKEFVDYEPDYKLIEQSTLQQIEWILE